jgi:ABC-type branched-subunit amino acid transport system substrate-binding protein
VAKPPGAFVSPGEFKNAFKLLDSGKEINYEGASGTVDFDENGDVLTPIEIWKFDANGKIVTFRTETQIPEE